MRHLQPSSLDENGEASSRFSSVSETFSNDSPPAFPTTFPIQNEPHISAQGGCECANFIGYSAVYTGVKLCGLFPGQ